MRTRKRMAAWRALAAAAVVAVTLTGFGAVALAHEDGPEGHHRGDSRQQEQRNASGARQEQRSAAEERPPAWAPVAFTVSGLVVVGGIVLILRRS